MISTLATELTTAALTARPQPTHLAAATIRETFCSSGPAADNFGACHVLRFRSAGGQIAAMTQQLPPETCGGGLAQQQRQMRLKTSPINSDQFAPALNLRTIILAIKPSGNGRRIDRPIRLRKLRQADDADATVPTQKPAHPNQQNQRRGGGDITVVISQPFQDVRLLAIGTVLRRLDLLVILLFAILFGGQ